MTMQNFLQNFVFQDNCAKVTEESPTIKVLKKEGKCIVISPATKIEFWYRATKAELQLILGHYEVCYKNTTFSNIFCDLFRDHS